MKKLIHVAAAVILDSRGHILLAQRPADKHQGGLWEFPGGKVEPGEPVVDALHRELDEELGIQLTQAEPLIRIPHHYPDKSVLLDVYTVSAFNGEPWGREGQPVRWVAPVELADYEFPAANKPIVTAALLSDRLAISMAPESVDEPGFIERLVSTVDHHKLQQLVLRAPALNGADYSALVGRVRQGLGERELTLFLHCDVAQANALEAAALHLSSSRLRSLESRAQFRGRWLGASCHTEEELRMAVEKGLDYVTLSPVQPTASHPGEPALGWARFEALAAELTIPVYALGGVGEEALSQAKQAGAQGVAGIRCWWSA